MIEARDHNGCTVMALDDIVFHETWCDYVRELVLVFCENNSIVNNNNNNNKKKKKENNNENSTEFSVLQILTALNFQLYIQLLVFEALMFAAGTGNVAGLQVLLDKQANPTVEDYQATGNGYSYPTKGERKLIFPSTLGWDIGIWYSSQDGKSIVVMNHGEPRYDK